MEVHVLGSIAYDRILFFDGNFGEHILPGKVHELSVSFDIGTIDESFGGTAGNIVYTLALLGAPGIPYGMVGDDFGKYEAWFSSHNIPTDRIVWVPGTLSSQAHIMTDRNDNQITGFHQGAGRGAYTGTLPRVAELAIIAPANPDIMKQFALHYRKLKTRYIFDPGQQTTTFTKEQFTECLSGAWMFIANDYETALALKKTGWSEEELREKVPVVIETLGDNGSAVYADGIKHAIGIAWAEEVVDPTGAGDAYRAGLLAGIARGFSITIAARMGATAASYAVEKKGTQNHTFTKEAFAARHEKAFSESLAL